MRRFLEKLKAAALDAPLSAKILGICAASIMFALAAISSIDFIRDAHAFSAKAKRDLHTLALIIESNTSAALRFSDAQRAAEYVNTLEHHADITSACIFDANGNSFAHYAKDPKNTPPPRPEFEGIRQQEGRIQLARAIKLDGANIGQILIEMDTQSLEASIRHNLFVSLGLFLGGSLLTLLLASRLQRFITDPVRELLELSEDVTHNKDYSKRAQKRSRDEIGTLVDSVNQMLEAISRREAKLVEINSTLEQTIAERTEDLRKRNEELKEAMEAAKAASVAKSEFLATTSHELRTPLNPIIGYAEMMLRDESNASSARKLTLIQQSAKNLLALIDEILDFNRIERGEIKLNNSEDVDYQKLCQDAVALLSPNASSKKIRLEYHHLNSSEDDHTPEKLISVDSGKLRQIVLNLIGNAIKFTNEGSVSVSTQLAYKNKAEGTLRIKVSDTGIGISSQDAEKVFKPFTQIDGSFTREYGGMGLGLAICRKIVTAMAGSIQYESQKGVGTTFSLELPVKVHSPRSEDCPETTKTIPSESPQTTKAADILLVEDEAVNRELMRSLLRGLGHTVSLAKDGIEALEHSSQKTFDAIILDISMPRLNGFDTAIELRKEGSLNQRTPIIAMTAHAHSESRDRCLEVGMDEYLSKPVSYAKLKTALDKWLGALNKA